MNSIDRITSSPARPKIDLLLMENYGYDAISHEVRKEFDVYFSPDEIKNYKSAKFSKGESTVHDIIRTTENINNELPAISDSDRLAEYFSFKKTSDDLEVIYERIRELKRHAAENPEVASYDRRIKDYLAQAEAIRTRVFRHQYENVRKALLLTIGKKLVAAAVSILLPYIHREKKKEALARFEDAIKPLLEDRVIPDIPKDVTPPEGSTLS